MDALNLHPRRNPRAGTCISENHRYECGTSGGVTGRNEMACRKPLVLLRAMDDYPHEPWYGLFDADLLVRRPLPDLWATLRAHQRSPGRTALEAPGTPEQPKSRPVVLGSMHSSASQARNGPEPCTHSMERFADGSLSPSSAIWSAHHGDKEALYASFAVEYGRQRALPEEQKTMVGKSALIRE